MKTFSAARSTCAFISFQRNSWKTPLNELASLVYEVRLAYDWRPQLSDADDEKVLDAAINGFADAIVTHNLRHFTPARARFGIAVVTPAIIMEERFR